MGVVCSSPSNVQVVATSLRKASTSARDDSDSYIADGDAHDPSMERSSGVVAASTLRLYERNTQPLNHVDTAIPGAQSLDVLSELEVGQNLQVAAPTRALTGRFRAKATSQEEDAGLQSPTKASSTSSDPAAPWYMAALPAAVMRHRTSSSSQPQPQSRPISHAGSLQRTSEPPRPSAASSSAPDSPNQKLVTVFGATSHPAFGTPQKQQLTAVSQNPSPLIPSLGITERLSSIGRSQPAVRADSGSLSGARTQRQFSVNESIQRTASIATDGAEVRSSLPPHFHLPTEQQQQNAATLQHTISSITMPHALSRPTSAAPIRTAFSAATESDQPRIDYGPRSPEGGSRAQPLPDTAADTQNSNRPGNNSLPIQEAPPLTRSRSATATFSGLAALSFNRKSTGDPPPSLASNQVSPGNSTAQTTPIQYAIEDYCQGNTRPRSAESSSCRPSWTGSTPFQLPPGGVSRAGLGSACLILSQLPPGLSAESAAQRQLSSRGSGRAGSTGRAVSPSPSFLISTQSSTAQGASSPYAAAGTTFQKLPLLILPTSSNDGTHALSSAREKSRSGSVGSLQPGTWQPLTPTSAHAESSTPRSTTNDTHVIPFTVNGSGNNDSSGSGSMSKSNKQPAYSPTSAAALLLAAATAFNGFGLPQQPQHPSSDSSSARVTAAEVGAAVLRQPISSEIQLDPVQQLPYTPSLLEQQQQHLVLPPPAYLQAKRRASMPSTQLPKYAPAYAVDVARRQQQQSHLYREMDNVSSSNHIPLLEDEPSYCSTVANEAVVEDPGRCQPSWSMELEQDLLASLPPPQYHRRTCAATASGYVSDAMMEDRPRHWATDATAAAADEEAAARNAAGFEQRMFNLLPHAKYDRGTTNTSSGGGARTSAASSGKSKSEKISRVAAGSVSRPPIPIASAMV